MPRSRTNALHKAVAATLAVVLASTPLAQAPATPPPAPDTPGIWTQVPSQPDPPIPSASQSALREGAINASRSSLPDLGDSSQAAFSPAQERRVGEAIMRQVRAQGGYMQDPEVNDYLNELGYRLVNASFDAKQDFEFFAVPDAQINAFALPGGYIGVHTGLIVLAQNESELAAVLAHEISHVTQRHMARMIDNQKNSMLLSLAGLALAILASRAGGGGQGVQAAIASTQALSIQNRLDFTRDNEYEADRIGFSRLVAAGFDPNAQGGVHGKAPAQHPLRRRQHALVPAHAPDHVRADRGGAGARGEHALPPGARLARLPPGARAPPQLPGRRARAGRQFRRRAAREEVQQRDRGTLRPRCDADARQEHSAREDRARAPREKWRRPIP
jgi:hypothetical protein